MKNVKGERIYWQLFNIPLWTFVMIFVEIVVALSIMYLFKKHDLSEYLASLKEYLFLIYTVAILAVLSVANRFMGKTVAVLTSDSLYFGSSRVLLKDIKMAEYELGYLHPSAMFSYLRLDTLEGEKTILHAPLYILGKIRKASPTTYCRVSKSSISSVTVPFVFTLAIFEIISFL